MPTHRFVHTRRVEFVDTDVAGIMHFSNFFRFMEATEHAFYRSLGFSVHAFQPESGGPNIGWPRVHAEADFHLPLTFEEEVEIELLVEEVRNKSIHYQFRFWKTPPDQAKALAATGKFSVVCIAFGEQGRGMEAIAIPEAVRAKIGPAPAEVLTLTEG